MAFNQRVHEEILRRLENGESLTKICEGKDMPSAAAYVENWVGIKENAKDAEQRRRRHDDYSRARQIGWMTIAERMRDIAADGSNDIIDDGSKANRKVNNEIVQRSKLRIETDKWLLSKMLPKVFGDLKQIEHSGPNGAPIQTVTAALPPDEAAKAYLDLMQ